MIPIKIFAIVPAVTCVETGSNAPIIKVILKNQYARASLFIY